MREAFIKYLVSLLAFLLIVARLKWPSLNIDSITIGLVIVVALPWLIPAIQSVKLPGGTELTLRDVKAAAEKLTEKGPETDTKKTSSQHSNFGANPNVALVALRIDVERQIRDLASAVGIEPDQPLRNLLRELRDRQQIDKNFSDGVEQLIIAGDRAAHGASVETGVSEWIADYGPAIINTLEKKVVQVGHLRLRVGPDLGSPILQTLSRNEHLDILRRTGDWAEVRTSDGAVGWVLERYLTEEPDSVK